MRYPRILPKAHRAAFTLIELLVVVSIIGLLVALLLPALSKSKLQATLLLGKADMGSIGKAIFIYAADNQTWAPCIPPFANNNHNSLEPGGAVGYQVRAVGGWTIWDASDLAAAAGNTLYPLGRGPTGLGQLLSRPASVSYGASTGYLDDIKVFFHPVMRNEGTGGGSARHWFNAQRNWGKYQTDATIVTTGWVGGANNWSVALGGIINSTIMYRGGDWTPNGDGVNYNAAQYRGRDGYDRFQQLKTDYPNFNRRILLMSNLFEQQCYRMGGVVDYMTGDGAVRTTSVRVGTHSEFWNASPSGTGNNTGVNAINSPTANLVHPSSGATGAGVGQLAPYVAYKIEKEDLAMY